MKTFIAFSLLVAGSCAQVNTFLQPDFFGPAYAPGFGYGRFGAPVPLAAAAAATVANPAALTPASTLKTEHVLAAAAPVPAQYYNPYFLANSFYPHSAFYNYPAAAVAAVPAAAAAVPAVPAPALDDIEVVEADSAPLVAAGPVTIRAIFPIFGTGDLRGGSDSAEIIFARPDEVAPVAAVEESDVPAVTIVNPDLAAPLSGSVQSSQPTFFYRYSPFQPAVLRV